MKKSHLTLFIAIFSAFLTPHISAHPVLSDSYVALGKGCTTAYYIDDDCDGYGVGIEYTLGPDADDFDPDVNTPASVNAKYGDIDILDNLASFLQARGYPWDNDVNDVYYISPDGDDDTGEANDPTKPFSTWYGVRYNLQPGDLLLLREGVNDVFDMNYGGETNGDSVGGHIIAMAYPGEEVYVYDPDSSSSSLAILPSSSYPTRNYWIFDGLILGAKDTSRPGSAIKGGNFQNMTFRNLEVPGRASGMYCFQNMHNILVEKSVWRDSTNTHVIYVGSRELPNSNMVFRDNIIYNGSSPAEYTPAFQHNGRVTNLIVEGNIIHSNGAVGAAWLSGVDDSVFRNNLLFNNNKDGFQIGKYIESYGDANNENNLIINNIIWAGQYENADGEGYEPYRAISFHNSYDDDPHSGNTFRNNILASYGYPLIGSDQDNHITTSFLENNILYRIDGQDTIASSSQGNSWDFAELEALANADGNAFYTSDAFFEDVSVDYYLSPDVFDFDHREGGSAIDFGTTTGAPGYDLRGDSRDSKPDSGCYEYGGAPPTCTDIDEDGYGNPASSACTFPQLDCDDNNESINPAATEVCNGVDDNCMNGIDEGNVCNQWSLTHLQDGTGSNKLELIFIPSGFTESQSSAFEEEAQSNLDMLWQNNFFSDFRQSFDVYRVDDQYDSDGGLKTDTEIESLIDTYDACGFGDSGTCRKIHIIIEDYDVYSDFTEINFVRLRLPADDGYTLAHELSVHVLGNLWPYGGPIMKDEYIIQARCDANNYTYTFINAHDRDSNEKWSDLVSTEPFPGSAYCSHFYRPTENSIARGSNNKDCDPVGYRAAEIGLAKRTQDGSLYSETTPPAVYVSGVSEGANYFNSTTITVDATDSSGIDRVEFYLSIDGQEFRSVGIDRTEPYSHFLDLTLYPGTEYWLRIYVFDEAWNMFGHHDSGSQFGPIYHGDDIHRADTSEPFGCIDMAELSAFITLWFTNSQGVTMPELMRAVTLWRAGTGCLEPGI